jgi:hypothetical protein
MNNLGTSLVYECGVDLPAEIMPASCHGVVVHERVLPPWTECGEALPHPELKDVEGRVEGERGEHVGVAGGGGCCGDEEGLDVVQVVVEGGEDGGAEGEMLPAGEADGDGEEGLAHGGLRVAQEDKAGEPEGEEGGMLLLKGGGMVMGEEVLDLGGVVRLLAGTAIEVKARPIEGYLVGAPLGSEPWAGNPARRVMSWRVMVALPQGKAKVLVREHQKEARNGGDLWVSGVSSMSGELAGIGCAARRSEAEGRGSDWIGERRKY